MGMGHIKSAYALWGELPDRQFRMFIYMAMRLPDEIDDPIWFGTQEELAVAIGKSPEEVKERPATVKREVRRMLKSLVDYGALSLERAEAPGRRAEYRLCTSMERWRDFRHR